MGGQHRAPLGRRVRALRHDPSDLLDTALAVQLAEASDLLIAKATRLVAVLRDHALAHRDTLRAGRTHGVHAEPDTWGHRVADFAFAVARSRDRIVRARDAVAVGKLSGPVGSYSNIDPAIEAEVMPALGLRAADVATQVVMRDGIADGSARWPWPPRSARRSRWRSGTASGPRSASWPSRSAGPEGLLGDAAGRTRSVPSGSPAWPGWSVGT